MSEKANNFAFFRSLGAVSAPGLLLPAFYIFLYFRQLAPMKRWLFDAVALLCPVVVEQSEGIASEEGDGDEVAGCEEGHEEVDDVPNELEAGHGTEHHHQACRAEAVNGHHRLVVRNEADVSLTVVVVADDARESEEEDGDGDEHGSDGAHLRLQSRLREGQP